MCSRGSFVFFVILVCVHIGTSQVVQFGSCADVTTVTYFDLERVRIAFFYSTTQGLIVSHRN